MPTGGYKETGRFLYLETPLGPDKFLLDSFHGAEAISELFQFRLNVRTEIDFDFDWSALLNQKVNFGLTSGAGADERHFNGIVSEISQLAYDDATNFNFYQLEVVPQFWLLKKKFRSRIFQQKNIPDILREVLAGLDVDYQIQGTFEPRDYCTQYQESDFAFASRLMEEEGIFYFHRFSKGNHKLIVANSPQAHQPISGRSTITFENDMGGTRPEEGGRIISWQKLQRLRSSKYTLWDHSFELAHKHLEADKPMRATVQVGKKSHKLKILSEDHEIYEFPGGYAQRFDGIAPGGGERPADVQKIFTDNKRTVGLRMEEQEARVMLNRGLSDQRQLMAGHKFTLEKHKEDGDGEYVILSVQHNGSEGSFRGGEGQDGSPSYQNSFTALASAIPFRPPLVTPRPKIAGPQTAVVVGPSGEEIFTDKYGRVKVQFHWDRDGQNDANSSCWCRVSTLGAGTGYGFLLTPRIGWEVIVAFLEGDPDQPIITGCVYNPLNMPFDQLPEKKSVWGLRSRSTLGGSADNFNELRFEDKKGSEQVYLRAEKDLDVYVKNDSRTTIGQDQHEHVKRDRKEQIDRDLLAKVKRNRKTEVGGNDHLKVGGNEVINVGGNLHEQVGNFAQKAGQNHAVEAGMEIHLKAGMKIVIEAGVDLTLKGPGGFVNIGPAGVAIQGTMVLINSGGAAGAGSGASPESPEAPDPPSDADTDKGYTSSGTAS